MPKLRGGGGSAPKVHQIDEGCRQGMGWRDKESDNKRERAMKKSTGTGMEKEWSNHATPLSSQFYVQAIPLPNDCNELDCHRSGRIASHFLPLHQL